MAKKLEGIMNTQVGTPITMAPEVYHGKYDEKVDIWSVLFYHLFQLGVIIYKLIFGKYPFNTINKQKLIEDV